MSIISYEPIKNKKMVIAGKASEVFLFIELLAKYFGDVTIGELLG